MEVVRRFNRFIRYYFVEYSLAFVIHNFYVRFLSNFLDNFGNFYKKKKRLNRQVSTLVIFYVQIFVIIVLFFKEFGFYIVVQSFQWEFIGRLEITSTKKFYRKYHIMVVFLMIQPKIPKNTIKDTIASLKMWLLLWQSYFLHQSFCLWQM